jgi:hypothetical protein
MEQRINFRPSRFDSNDPKLRGKRSKPSLTKKQNRAVFCVRHFETKSGKVGETGGKAILIEKGGFLLGRIRSNDERMTEFVESIDEGIDFVTDDRNWIAVRKNGRLEKGSWICLRELGKEKKRLAVRHVM